MRERFLGFPKLRSKIFNFFTNNFLGKWLFNPVIYQGQTVELALNGNNYGATLFYLFNPKSYLAGNAMGTCYIAECLHDFGWVAAALVSCLYGYLLCTLDRALEKNSRRIASWKTMILFLFADGISRRDQPHVELNNSIRHFFSHFLFSNIFRVYAENMRVTGFL